jgi:hypothetical protein
MGAGLAGGGVASEIHHKRAVAACADARAAHFSDADYLCANLDQGVGGNRSYSGHSYYFAGHSTGRGGGLGSSVASSARGGFGAAGHSAGHGGS